jgi:curli biogenesis system outer membrane secretion channel CsgG
MKQYLLAAVLTLASISSSAFADSSSWMTIGESSDSNYKVLAKSSTLKIGPKNISVLVQYLIRKSASDAYDVSYFKVTLPKQACEDGVGNLSFSPLSNDGPGAFTSEYVSEGASVGANIGDHLCNALKN